MQIMPMLEVGLSSGEGSFEGDLVTDLIDNFFVSIRSHLVAVMPVSQNTYPDAYVGILIFFVPI